MAEDPDEASFTVKPAATSVELEANQGIVVSSGSSTHSESRIFTAPFSGRYQLECSLFPSGKSTLKVTLLDDDRRN